MTTENKKSTTPQLKPQSTDKRMPPQCQKGLTQKTGTRAGSCGWQPYQYCRAEEIEE